MTVLGERRRLYSVSQNRAKSRIRHALQRGHLTVGACERIGEDCRGKIHAHHDDYSRPLDIRWLCALHHREVHKEIGRCPRCRARWIPEAHDGRLRCLCCLTDHSPADRPGLRFLAILSLAMLPFAAAAWSALHWDATGAEGGVIWCICLLAALTAFIVAAAHSEARHGD